MASLDKAIELSQKAQRDAESGQHGLFGVFEPEHNTAERLPNTPDWMNRRASVMRKRFWAYSLPATRWKSTPISLPTSTPKPPRKCSP